MNVKKPGKVPLYTRYEHRLMCLNVRDINILKSQYELKTNLRRISVCQIRIG